MAVQTPHLLKAASNVRRMEQNLTGILGDNGRSAIAQEVGRNTLGLLKLSNEHYAFADGLSRANWRQKMSRLYYAAFHARRAIHLFVEGSYSTDVSDHKNVGSFPDDFPNRDTYKTRLVDLRNDRNLADYDHEATEPDLLIPVGDAVSLVRQLLDETRQYLSARGLP